MENFNDNIEKTKQYCISAKSKLQIKENEDMELDFQLDQNIEHYEL